MVRPPVAGLPGWSDHRASRRYAPENPGYRLLAGCPGGPTTGTVTPPGFPERPGDPETGRVTPPGLPESRLTGLPDGPTSRWSGGTTCQPSAMIGLVTPGLVGHGFVRPVTPRRELSPLYL